MAKRKRLSKEGDDGGAYFGPRPRTVCFSSGCNVLDCALGGEGWAEHRIINIVGDRSTGKTLLAIESCVNFAAKYADGLIKYAEAEAAFDVPYAQTLGMPVDRVDFPDEIVTVEDLYKDLSATIDHCNKNDVPALYIVDSLDALSDEAEQGRDFDNAGTYGTNKPKQLSSLFRRINKKLNQSRVTVIVISQVRDKIGVTFGKKQTRSGGKALDFYASQIVWLAHKGRIHATRKKVKRVIGIDVTARVEKNKVGPPFREANFPIYFNYGIDDIKAGLDYLEGVGELNRLDIFSASDKAAFIKRANEMSQSAFLKRRRRVSKAVKNAWVEVEERFAPVRTKYDG